MKKTQTGWARWAGVWVAAALLAGPVTVVARDNGYQDRTMYQTTVRHRDRDHGDYSDRHYRGSRDHYKQRKHYKHYKHHKHHYHGHGYGHYVRPGYPPRYSSHYRPRYYDRGYGIWDFSLNYRYRD